MRSVLACALASMFCVGLCACDAGRNGGAAQDAGSTVVVDGQVLPDAAAGVGDRDRDGVCDDTELGLGTSSDALDSDGDGYPDFVELVGGFDAVSAQSPGPDQVAFLSSEPGARIDFELRTTLEGNGQGYWGELGAYTTFNDEDLTADEFLTQVVAVDGEPADQVQGVTPMEPHFTAITGRTRVLFRASFQYRRVDEFPCAESFPFRFGVKADDGRRFPSRDYTLIVTPASSQDLEAESYCLPSSGCL